MVDSESDSDDDGTKCVGLCLKYKMLYEHLKGEHEHMNKEVSEYDPVKEHPEILKVHKKHHHKSTTADDFDSNDKHAGKKSAAADF